ncbi:porin [Parasutterella muris]|nr:porin [Parasutterella muris]
MKFSKTLLAAVVMTAAPFALAESNVTLYGSIDGAVAVQKEKLPFS